MPELVRHYHGYKITSRNNQTEDGGWDWHQVEDQSGTVVNTCSTLAQAIQFCRGFIGSEPSGSDEGTSEE